MDWKKSLSQSRKVAKKTREYRHSTPCRFEVEDLASQKISFSPSWIIRGDPALVITPVVGWLMVRFGKLKFGWLKKL